MATHTYTRFFSEDDQIGPLRALVAEMKTDWAHRTENFIPKDVQAAGYLRIQALEAAVELAAEAVSPDLY